MLDGLRGRLKDRKPEESARRRLEKTIIVGRDEFLFHHDQHTVAQVSGQRPLSAGAVNHWVSATETRAAWCRERGIPFRFLMVPEKHVVYADKLPDEVAISDDRPALQILSGLDEAGRDATLYPAAELAAARDTRDTYLRTDTHWSYYGAYTTYRALLASLAPDCTLPTLPDTEVAWFRHEMVGDLGVRLFPERGEAAETFALETHRELRTVFDNKHYGRGGLTVFETDTIGPRLVLFRDSFALHLLPFLARSFSRIVMVASQSVHYDLLRFERPDIVVAQMAERFLGMPDAEHSIVLPQDLDAPDFETFIGTSFTTALGTRGGAQSEPGPV